MWTWPLLSATPMFPDEPGSFAAARRHDMHTGVDLYCEVGQPIVAVEDGEVVSIEHFTGPNADDPSPWWNDTDAMLVRGASGVVTYGEVEPRVAVGDKVKAGQTIAVVACAVLKRFKGRPMVMLHLELMTPEADGTQWWNKTNGVPDPKPEVLLDPTPHLIEAAGGHPERFDLATYDGVSFRDE